VIRRKEGAVKALTKGWTLEVGSMADLQDDNSCNEPRIFNMSCAGNND